MLLPPRCVSCRDITVSQAGLCATCWSGLTLIDAPRCAVTGVPFPYGDGDDLISPAALKALIANPLVGDYAGAARRARACGSSSAPAIHTASAAT